MKKGLIASVIFLFARFSFSGDVAAFYDIGFSNDGKFYAFAQYGKTDIKFCPFAEIYMVDVEKNLFVPGKVFKSRETNFDKSGRQVFEELYGKNVSEISAYGCEKVCMDGVLYLPDNEKKNTDDIFFKNYGDDENPELVYTVRLLPDFHSKGESSFYIELTLIGDTDGHPVKRYKIGSPDIKRKGVVDYKVSRIFRNKDKSAMVFVIEKTVEDSSGTSIRYMVETVKL